MEIKEPKFKPEQAITFNLKGKITSSKVVYCAYVTPLNQWQYVTEFDELFFIPEHCAVETPNYGN
jgi:hypothetical protein